MYAINEAGRSTASSEVNFTVGATVCTIAPSPPGALQFSLSGRQVMLASAAPPGTYVVRIRAINACGTSAPGPETTIVVP